jgi:hypothetical protein
MTKDKPRFGNPKMVNLKVPKDLLEEILKAQRLESIPGMSETMRDKLKENGITDIFDISSKDPLILYDQLRDKSGDDEDLDTKWQSIEYRHEVLNALNMATMELRKRWRDRMNEVDALCPSGLWSNPENGITRLTAFVMAEMTWKVSDLPMHSALEFYVMAMPYWNFSQLEALEFYQSILMAKKIQDESYDEDEAGPDNPRGP